METIRERLIGTWRLVSYQVRSADGSVVYPMGKEVVGTIMYLADGYMSAMLMVPGRAPLSGGSAASATFEELVAAVTGFFAYVGRFEVDEAAKVVTHHIEIALAPQLVGTVQRRHVLFGGRRLRLRGDPAPIAGQQAVPVITWERATPDDDSPTEA